MKEERKPEPPAMQEPRIKKEPVDKAKEGEGRDRGKEFWEESLPSIIAGYEGKTLGQQNLWVNSSGSGSLPNV
jgi:hypothetical protein